MSKKPRDEFSKVLEKKASVVISDMDQKGGLNTGEILAWRRWFSSRQRELRSSGGRPTNPRWTLKRQVSFSPETWRDLEARAEACSVEGKSIGPGQLAAFLIEEAVLGQSACSVGMETEADLSDEALVELNPQYKQWELPELFAGSVT